jgi:hypothetical protein
VCEPLELLLVHTTTSLLLLSHTHTEFGSEPEPVVTTAAVAAAYPDIAYP